MSRQVLVDPELCIGSAECVRIASAAFRIEPRSNISHPTEAAETVDLALIEEAVRSCPTGAISFHTVAPGEDVQE